MSMAGKGTVSFETVSFPGIWHDDPRLHVLWYVFTRNAFFVVFRVFLLDECKW